MVTHICVQRSSDEWGCCGVERPTGTCTTSFIFHLGHPAGELLSQMQRSRFRSTRTHMRDEHEICHPQTQSHLLEYSVRDANSEIVA